MVAEHPANKQRTLQVWRWLLIWPLLVGLGGCAARSVQFSDAELAHVQSVATQIEYPDIDMHHAPIPETTPPPITIRADRPPEAWNLSLQEAVQRGLQHSKVLKDLGGLVLQSPGNLSTVHGPALQETDPRFGVEAALAEFDTSFAVHAFFENNDRALNNSFFGGGTRLLKQDFMDYSMELAKKTAMGGDLALRHNMEYDANNAPGNLFPSAWNTNVEAEFRQPLLQGAGVDFNRIAGPNASPGQLRGVLLARTSYDISLADFEIGVRNLVSDIENAYWELYYAYRDLDAKVAARERALKTWRVINDWKRRGREGGEADKEAQAREQYYRLEEEVQNALTGRLIEPSRNNTFRGIGGVHANERRLRQIIGAPINDGRLIRPSDEPQMARVVFDWDDIILESQERRPELRRQKWVVKRRELEYQGTKNFLLPRLDAVGRYRFRGFGKSLLDPDGNHKPLYGDAFSSLTNGDLQEWQLGFELSVPIGYRKAHAAVRNAELSLARDVAVLEEQQRAVAHDLSAAVAEMTRAYVVAKTAFNRRVAARQQVEALEIQNEDPDPSQVARLIDQLLDSQRRLAEAESRYYRAIIEYTLSIKNVHFNKGSLLDYNDVHLAEGDWPGQAYHDSARRARNSRPPLPLVDHFSRRSVAAPVSQGPYMQQLAPHGGFAPGPDPDVEEAAPNADPAPAGEQPQTSALIPTLFSTGTVSPGAVAPGTVAPGVVTPGAAAPGTVAPAAGQPMASGTPMDRTPAPPATDFSTGPAPILQPSELPR